MELRVQERTDELQRYMQKLEESNKALQEFAFIASHDLQEPLRKVQAFGNLLLDKQATLGEQGRDYLKRMMNSVKRMSEMIESLLTYSRVASRAEEFRKVDLKRVVSEVADDLSGFQPQAVTAGIHS